MFRKLGIVTFVLVAVAIAPRSGHAVELGLTPSHVFSVWQNINSALMTVARVSSGGADLGQRLGAVAPGSFEGKKPADVLKQVSKCREKLDRLRSKSGLKATGRYQNDGGTVTPSLVFLNSGAVLDGVVLWVVKNTTKEQLVSQFYTRHDISGKTPSDVFGLVDLATRRLDLILASSGN